jgi:hypothetical protein
LASTGAYYLSFRISDSPFQRILDNNPIALLFTEEGLASEYARHLASDCKLDGYKAHREDAVPLLERLESERVFEVYINPLPSLEAQPQPYPTNSVRELLQAQNQFGFEN